VALTPGSSRGAAVVLARRPWYAEESRNSKPEQAQTCAAGTPRLRDKLSQVRSQAVSEESAGSSHLVFATCVSVSLSKTAARSSHVSIFLFSSRNNE